MSLARYGVVPYGVAAVALPFVAYVAQPAQCFQYFYAPKIVPAFALLSLITGGVQHLSVTSTWVKVVCAIVFAIGIQFTLIVPCIDTSEPSRSAGLALWSVLFGGAASVAMAVVAFGMFRRLGGVLPLRGAVVGTGQMVSAFSILLTLITGYLGIVTSGDSSLIKAATGFNHGLILLSGIALTVAGIGASLWSRRPQE